MSNQNPSAANTVEARHFRYLLSCFVDALDAAKASFVGAEKTWDPLRQREAAAKKDEARDRLFLCLRPDGSRLAITRDWCQRLYAEILRVASPPSGEQVPASVLLGGPMFAELRRLADGIEQVQEPQFEEERGDPGFFGVAGSSAQAETSPAARDVLAERQRQVTQEGWTPAHDDGHDDRSLALAAMSYTLQAARAKRDYENGGYLETSPPSTWPWDRAWWKPKNPRRDLVRAGALILAEIERIDRATGAPQ